MRKKSLIICIWLIIVKTLGIFILFGSFIFFIINGDSIKYETSRDKIIYSPSGDYYITLRYDYVSRPYIFKDNKLIFETNRPGFTQTVDFEVEWKSENEILLYYDLDDKKYKDDIYDIIIN